MLTFAGRLANGDTYQAEDLVQDTFIKAQLALEKGTEPENPSTWLHAILINRHRDTLRSAAVRPSVPIDFQESEATVVGRPNSAFGWRSNTGSVEADVITSLEVTNVIDSTRAALDDSDETEAKINSVLLLAMGYSQTEIADMQAVAVGTIKSRISRTRSLMRELVENPVTEES